MYFLRMNEKIMRWPSAQFYKGELMAAPSVANLSLSDLGKIILKIKMLQIAKSYFSTLRISQRDRGDKVCLVPVGYC